MFLQFFQCRVDRTAAVEQTIHLFDDLPQFAQLRKTSSDSFQCFTHFFRQFFLNEKKTVVEQRRDLRLNPFVLLDRALVFGFRRAPALGSLRHRLGQFAADFRHRFQDRRVDLFQDVKTQI